MWITIEKEEMMAEELRQLCFFYTFYSYSSIIKISDFILKDNYDGERKINRKRQRLDTDKGRKEKEKNKKGESNVKSI